MTASGKLKVLEYVKDTISPVSNFWPSFTKQSPMLNFLNNSGFTSTPDVKSPQLTWMFSIAQPELHSFTISTSNKLMPLDDPALF